MADDAEVLKSVEKLPANEQAAALAHWIYTQTTHRDDTTWSARVAEAWINAVHDYGKRHISKQSQGTQKPSAIG